MKIILIGAGGMLGYVTYQYLSSQGHQVAGVTRTRKLPGMTCLDVTDQRGTEAFLKKTPCDAIVNCAALLVKASEENKSAAVKLNAWFPHWLAEYCARHGIYLIQVSTDGVFSGETGGYDEDAPSDADSFYGKSKFLGEVSDGALTVRSGFWGPDVNPNGLGLFNWFMRQTGPVLGYSKAIFNGVSSLEFAQFVNQAIKKRWTGIFHLCAAEPISKYDFLLLQKEIFDRQVSIYPNDSVCVNRRLNNSRADILYKEKTFAQMMEELWPWLQGRDDFSHYFGGRE